MATMTLTMTSREYKMVLDMVKANGIDSEWSTVREIETFANDNGENVATLETTVAFGITFYRWAVDAQGEWGSEFTREEQAVREWDKAARKIKAGQYWC